MTKVPLDILMVEDVPTDAVAIEEQLAEDDLRFRIRRTESRPGFLSALHERPPDIVLSDFTLPEFDALEALSLLKNFDSDIPFILVTGARSEEVAVECIRAGADDYILKSSLKRLGASIRNAIQKKAAEREKKRGEQALRKLPQLIRDAQEAERCRVARELHDGVIQVLSSIRFRSQALEERLSGVDPDIKLESAQISELLDNAIREVRHISHNLLPSELYDLGLSAAVRRLVEDFRERLSSTILLTIELVTESTWSDGIKLNLYRIIQEALTNIEKHAQAKSVRVDLRESKAIVSLGIEDDGVGCAELASIQAGPGLPGSGLGIGLMDIRERAFSLGGTWDIQSEIGAGTKLLLTIPLPCP